MIVIVASPSIPPFDTIARLERTDARGCAGIDEIARSELEQRRELSDHLRNLADHLGEIGLLLHDAIDLEPDASACHVSNGNG